MRSFSASYSALDNFHAARTLFPLISGFLATAMICYKLCQHRSGWHILAGPLAFTAIYGLVGLIAASLSPNGPLALFWAFAYLSVPLVRWAVTWGNNSLELIDRLVNYNSYLISLAVVALFVFALLYLDFGRLLLTPESWYKCELNNNWNGHTWLSETGGNLRPTGVGRFAAIASIVGISAMAQRSRRYIWAVILVMALFLLFTSGARTAMVGFAVAAPMVIVLHWGRTGALVGILAAAVFVPLFLFTSIGNDFARGCLRATQTETRQVPSEPKVEIPKPARPVATPLLGTPQARLKQEEPTAVPRATIESGPNPTSDAVSQGPSTAVSQATIEMEPSPTPRALNQEQSTTVPRPTVEGVLAQSSDVLSQDQSTAVPQATIEWTPSPTIYISSQEQIIAAPQAKIPETSDSISSRRKQLESTPPPDSEVGLRGTPTANDQIISNGKSEPDLDQATKPPQVLASAAPETIPEKLAVSLSSESSDEAVGIRKTEKVTKFTSAFTTLSGRTGVWREGLELFKDSPVFGRGFHADRLLLGPTDPAGGRLGTHLHNSYIHALVQTGIIGFMPFITAMFYAWFLLVVVLRIRRRLTPGLRQMIIQSAGILVFLSIRTVTESTGAFFGVDWLILAPLLLYLQVLNRSLKEPDEGNENSI